MTETEALHAALNDAMREAGLSLRGFCRLVEDLTGHKLYHNPVRNTVRPKLLVLMLAVAKLAKPGALVPQQSYWGDRRRALLQGAAEAPPGPRETAPGPTALRPPSP